jgi:hypothetical protein
MCHVCHIHVGMTPVWCVHSVDSATQRAMAAAARLKDYGEEDDAPTSTALPSATSAFGQVSVKQQHAWQDLHCLTIVPAVLIGWPPCSRDIMMQQPDQTSQTVIAEVQKAMLWYSTYVPSSTMCRMQHHMCLPLLHVSMCNGYRCMQVEGPPAFLDPEATRPLARAAAHAAPQSSGMANASAAEPGDKQPFDIAKLAPKLKGDM